VKVEKGRKKERGNTKPFWGVKKGAKEAKGGGAKFVLWGDAVERKIKSKRREKEWCGGH